LTIDWLYFAFIGCLAGFFGGLLGIGGGSVTLPLLFFALKKFNLPDSDLMHIVLGTTFASMILNSATAVYFHSKRGFLPWKIVFTVLPSAILGPILGSYVATLLSGPTLRFSFGIFQVLLAIYFFLPRHKRIEVIDKPLHPLALNIPTFIIGTIGGILGIGGGIIMVPFLEMMGVYLKKAIGAAACTSCVMLTSSALGFLAWGLNEPPLLPYQVGFIYLPAFMIIALFSILTSFLGVQVVHRLQVLSLKRIFSIALAILGILVIVKD